MVSGEPERSPRRSRAIGGLLQLLIKGNNSAKQNVRYVLMLVVEGGESDIPQLTSDSICITSKGRPVKPKTIGQKKYVEAIKKNTVVLGVGPRRHGKNLSAVAMAVEAFRSKQVNRIILTRPAVEAGEKLGFFARRLTVQGGSLSASPVTTRCSTAGDRDLPEIS